jgi:hypothetical protein
LHPTGSPPKFRRFTIGSRERDRNVRHRWDRHTGLAPQQTGD